METLTITKRPQKISCANLITRLRSTVATIPRTIPRLLRVLRMHRPICNKCGDSQLIDWNAPIKGTSGWECQQHRYETGYRLIRW